MTKKCYYIFDHELGHFLYETLENFENNINTSSCSVSILDSIYDEVVKLYTSLTSEVNDKYLEYVGNMDEYRNKLKQEFIKIYNSDNNDYIEYISSLIDNFKIIDKNDLCDVYVKNRIIKEKKFIQDELFEKKYTNIMTSLNFIDVYYNSEFDEKIKLKNNSELPVFTHSKKYFLKNNSAQINELFANFTALLRDKNGKKYINILKSVCSSEVIYYLYQLDNLISYNYLNTRNNQKYK